jgi:type II secretory pathway component PulF
MNLDELAFFNRQLAEMLRSGIPLEGALRQLAATMRAGAFREEIRLLEADLARGTPLREALSRRQLPPLFIRLVALGALGDDLPGLLTLLADYYQRRHALWLRLRALMVYPAIVLAAALGLSLLLIWLYRTILGGATGDLLGMASQPAAVPLMLWLPPVWFLAAALLLALALAMPSWRNWLRWRLPGFKESNVAQFSGAMHLLLSRGANLAESVELMRGVEAGTPAGRELVDWRERIAAGQGKFAESGDRRSVFPRLFLWLVNESGENLAKGFQRAAAIYHQRAQHQMDMLLYAALPVAVLVLGAMILVQLSSSLCLIVSLLNALGGD